MPHFSAAHPAVRRLGLILAAALAVLGVTVPGVHAATTVTTTGSCIDGGGLVWRTKVVWNGTYTDANGVTRVSVDYAGWTTTLGAVPTDSVVKTYDGAGQLLQTLSRTASVDYKNGTVYGARNPLNPPSGAPRIVIALGRDGDGFGNCRVTHSPSTTADPVVAAVGDMVCAPGATVTTSACRQEAVSNSIIAAKPAALLTLGDNQYPAGSLADFRGAYAPSYGRVKSITSPTVGNHEYATTGAAGYFDYFGTPAGSRSKGYYSQDIGSWHVVTLNSERDISAGGAQMTWLKNDLAAHPNVCTLAVTHKPRFSSGEHGSQASMAPFFDVLVNARVELLLSGHDHDYERFAPQTASGTASSSGVRQVVVGTGGKSLYPITTVQPNSVARSDSGFGWLKLTLHRSSADLQYVPVDGNTFSDKTTITCG